MTTKFPTSRVQKLLAARWTALETAIEEGLEEASKAAAIDDLLPVMEGTTDDVGRSRDVDDGEEVPIVRTFTAPSGATLEFEHRWPLTAGRLVAAPLAEIRDWASRARVFERDEILRRVANDAGKSGAYAGETVKGAEPGGFGALRLVTFDGADAGVARRLKASRWAGEVLSVDLSMDGVVALLVHRGGGPIVYRTSDLAPGWFENGQGGAVLTLVERVRIERATTACRFRPAQGGG